MIDLDRASRTVDGTPYLREYGICTAYLIKYFVFFVGPSGNSTSDDATDSDTRSLFVSRIPCSLPISRNIIRHLDRKRV